MIIMNSVKKASAHREPMNLPSTHITTFEFGQARPTYYRFLDPSEKIKVTPSMLVRTAPLTYPMFGNAQFVHRGFFVPFRLFSPKFEDFWQNRKVNVNGVMRQVFIPHFSLGGLLRLLTADTFQGSVPSNAADLDLYLNVNSSISLGSKSGYGTGVSYCNGSYYLCSSASAYNQDSTAASDSFYYSKYWARNAFVKVKVATKDAAGTQGFAWSVGDKFKPSFGYDFRYWIATGSGNQKVYFPVFAQLTPFGRFVLKVLNSLGYKITFPYAEVGDGDLSSSVDSYFEADLNHLNPSYEEEFNGLALCSFLHALMDYYIPSQYVPSSVLASIFNYLTTPSVYSTKTSLDLSSPSNTSLYTNVFLKSLRFAFQICAGSDYFTDAWYNENSIIDGQFNDMSATKRFSDVTVLDGSRGLDSTVNVATNGTKFAMSGSPTGSQINDNTTDETHQWMRSLHNWVIRANLAGSRAMSNILAVFGIKPSNARSNRTEYCGKRVNELRVQDVTSTTSTQDSQGKDLAVLGEYAGKAWSVLDKVDAFEYEADEHGLFFVISSLVNHGGYVQGVDRFNLIQDWQDFYHPEMEKTGMQPVAVSEFLASPSLRERSSTIHISTAGWLGRNYLPKGIFGFHPRYGFMKYGKDYLTGDFDIPHLGGGVDGELQGYHMFRMFLNPNLARAYDDEESTPYGQFVRPVAQGEVLYDNGAQYNRIFNVIDNEQDHMQSVLQFDVSLWTPKLSISNSIDIDGFNEVGVDNDTFD